jgi:hypothetical protein
MVDSGCHILRHVYGHNEQLHHFIVSKNILTCAICMCVIEYNGCCFKFDQCE